MRKIKVLNNTVNATSMFVDFNQPHTFMLTWGGMCSILSPSLVIIVILLCFIPCACTHVYAHAVFCLPCL